MITRKDLSKLISLIVVSFTMAFVCSVFLNYLLDLAVFQKDFHDEMHLIELDSRIIMSQFTFILTFSMLGITTIFLVVSAIDAYTKEYQPIMGMLKALGYSNFKIASSFYKFGLTILLGCLLGYTASMMIAPIFYDSFAGESDINPQLTFQIMTIVYMVIMPTIIVGIIAILTAYHKLRKKPLDMIHHVTSVKSSKKLAVYQRKFQEGDYLKNIAKITGKNNRKTTWLVVFASFCFAAMLQMPITLWGSGFSLIGGVIMVVSAITLGCGILYIVLNIVIKDNQESIAIMKMCGYSDSECDKVFLKQYQYKAYFGFTIGSIYQFFLVQIVMKFYKDSDPNFRFDVIFRFDGLLVIMILFIVYYRLLLVIFKMKMKKVSYNQLLKG